MASQTTFTLQFEVILTPQLTREEHDPFATSYLTSDLAADPRFAQTELFGKRLWPSGDRPAGASRKQLKFVHSFAVTVQPDKRTTMAPDTAFCVQCFCELPNHKEERSSHRCGFAAFALLGMAECVRRSGVASFWDRMKDHGPSHDARGNAQVTVLDPESLLALADACAVARSDEPALLVGSPTDAGPRSALEVSTEYFFAIERDLLRTMPPTDDMIRVPKLPIYVLSGGATMPSCAFIQFAEPPAAEEEYYANALAVALRRNLPFAASDAERERLFCDEAVPAVDDGSGSVVSWNRKASILMDAATLLSVSFPYLYDYGISPDGSELVAADEFVRTGRITLALDCEDGSVETLVFLWHVLATARPGSRLMAAAQKVRMQYVVTLCLKAVTRPSQSNGGEDVEDEETKARRRGLAAHACCDMVPLLAFARMLREGGAGAAESDAVRAIVDERQKWLLTDEAVASKLRVAVGETTGYVKSYVAPRERAQREARAEVRSVVTPLFKSARLVSAEDMTVESGFYKFASSALVHDTLVSPAAQAVAREAGVEWLVPQLVYASKSSGGRARLSYGVPHPDYVACDQSVAACPVKPVPRTVARVVDHLAKFEHPIPLLRGPPSDVAAAFPIARSVADALEPALKSQFAGRRASTLVTVCIPLHDVTRERAEELAAELIDSPVLMSVSASVEVVTEHVATLVLQLTL